MCPIAIRLSSCNSNGGDSDDDDDAVKPKAVTCELPAGGYVTARRSAIPRGSSHGFLHVDIVLRGDLASLQHAVRDVVYNADLGAKVGDWRSAANSLPLI